MHADQFVEHGFPFMTSDMDLNPDPIGESVMPLSDFPFPPLLPNHVCDTWMKDMDFDSCHFTRPQFTSTEHAPWDAVSPLDYGFDTQNVLPSLYNAVGRLSCTTGRNDSVVAA